jgi:NAD(P)-dependent dehydrogenase (short-subunit alcohol dehydrogenase family)
MSSNQPVDPRERGPKPPFPPQTQSFPGSFRELNPPADHGETSYVGHGRLRGRSSIITGGDSGIGRAVAIAFAKEGANVVIAHLREEEADAKDTLEVVHRAGVKGLSVAGDVGRPEFCQELVAKAEQEFGRIDVLVNNAAFQMVRAKIEEVSPEELERTFRTNVFGTFFMTQFALSKMKPGACIINTCSIEAYTPEPGLLAYAATKAALVNLTKNLAKLASEKGVRVNGVAPGPVWTPLIPATMPKEKVQKFGENTIFGRPAQPVELAPIFVFLASDDASYVGGEIYGATGGRTPV